MAQVLEYVEKSLTDFEIKGLNYPLNLADGHASQDLSDYYGGIIAELTEIYWASKKTPVPEQQFRFFEAFARLANSPEVLGLPFKICPTASNSIEIVGDVLANKAAFTRLVEPTFDNLALILRRRRVVLASLNENDLFWAAASASIKELLDENPCDALFLVQPNNPTGRSLDARSFRFIAEYCAERGMILVLDNSFRFYNRASFNDYRILRESNVSFIALEDTGKVWPTQELKASLLICSRDLEQLVTTLYNEVYLCSSPYTLALLERFILKTTEVGLARTIWAQADEHRYQLRRAIAETKIVVDPSSVESKISVEWLNCRALGPRDLELTGLLETYGLTVLPGRQFFWESRENSERQFNIRLSLMKPTLNFTRAVDVFRSVLKSF